MSIKRITISVPSEVASRIKKAAGHLPVSAWVTEVIEEHLDDAELERQWQRFHADVKPKAADVRRASAMLRRMTKRGDKRGAA
jgi:predicted DNA-binding protein